MNDETLLLIARSIFIIVAAFAVGRLLRKWFDRNSCKWRGHHVRYDKNIVGDPYHCTRCLISLDKP